jgi:hypothetical protein
MLLEAATALALPFLRPPGVPASLVWLSTALLQVPRHRALGLGFDPRAHRLLVLSVAALAMT